MALDSSLHSQLVSYSLYYFITIISLNIVGFTVDEDIHRVPVHSNSSNIVIYVTVSCSVCEVHFRCY